MAPERAPTYIDKAKLQKEKEMQTIAEEKKTGLGSNYACTECGYVYYPASGDDSSGNPTRDAFLRASGRLGVPHLCSRKIKIYK